MVNKKILEQLTKLSYPGVIISYTQMNNPLDKNTITDVNGELARAIKNREIGEIVKAVYSGTRFAGRVATDNKGVVKVMDDRGNLKDIRVSIMNDRVLKLQDDVNKKVTTIEFKAPKVGSSNVNVPNLKTLQQQIIEALNKKKYTDKEVMILLTNMMNGK